MRLLHLARLSQDGGASQTGIESSDLLVRAWAEGNGHTVVHTAADKKSGTVQPWDRPNAKPWVTEPDKIAQYDGVVAYRFDRLSRGDDASTSDIEAWARDNGKQLLTEDGLIYPCEGVEGIRWDVTKRIAREEWLKTSERYRRMQTYLKDGGFLVGRPPFGYSVVCAEDCGHDGKECKHHKTMAPNKTGRKYVPQIFERYLAGDSITRICEWLDSEGVPPTSGVPWWPKSLGKVLRNPVYTGRRMDGNGKTILKVEGVVSMETQRKVIAKLDSAPRRRGAVSGDTALLTGILFCEKCNGPMYRKRTRDGMFYHCTPKRGQESCKNLIPLEQADGDLDVFLTTPGPNGIGHMEPKALHVTPGHGYQEDIAQVEQDIRELDLDDPEYDVKLSALRAERSRLKALPSVATKVEQRPMGVTVAQHWASLATTAERRQWLLDGRVVVLGSKEGLSVEVEVGGDWVI